MGNGLEGKVFEEQLRSLILLGPEQSRLSGGLVAAYSPSHGAEGQREHSALLSVTAAGPEGTAWERFCPRGHGTGCPGQWTQPQAARAQEELEHHSQTCGGAVQSQGLLSVILLSPFQCVKFYNSMKQGRKQEM